MHESVRDLFIRLRPRPDTMHVTHGRTATASFFRREDGSSDYEVLEKRGTLHVVRQPSPFSLTATTAERLKDWVESLLPGK